SAHRLIDLWLPVLESALIIADDDGGYRTFLGADPTGVETLAGACPVQERLDNSFVMSPALDHLDHRIDRLLEGKRAAPAPAGGAENGRTLVAPDDLFRFYPQMVEWAGRQINHLVREEGVAPGEIAILAPFVSDALRFSLQTTLERYGIALATHRPSRPLEAEPAARTLLTLARLAHPLWGMAPAPADVTLALTVAVERLDPVRASLLSAIVYPPRRRTNELGAFAAVNDEMR